MDFEEIRYELEGHLATITLDRPDRLNAFTGTMGRELIAAFDAADADDEVRAVIVTGAGRGFCAGADLGGGAGTFTGASGRRMAARCRATPAAGWRCGSSSPQSR